MARVLNDKAREWLDAMPPYYADDPFAQAVINALAAEYTRIEAAVNTLITSAGRLPVHAVQNDPTVNKAFPHKADDQYRLLALWELQLGLPVEPTNRTVAQRRQQVRAHLRRRRASSEAEWYEALREALGTSLWTYTVTDQQVTIRMPYAEANLTATQVVALARKITPAHLALAFAYDEGFILDQSPMDSSTF